MKKSGIISNPKYCTRISKIGEPSESPSHHIKGKGNTHHEPQSSEDDASDYENELNKKMQPRRVFGRDTRNKVRSSKKIVRTSSSAVGKSAKEHKSRGSSAHEEDGSDYENESTRNKGISVKKEKGCSSFKVGNPIRTSYYTLERQGKATSSKKSELFSSSEDDVSDFEKELNQVDCTQPSGPVTRSKGKSETSDCASDPSQVDGTHSSGPVTRSKGKSGTSDCASDLSQVATKSEDGTSDCASVLKMQPQFYVASKKARGFAGRSKVSEIKEEEKVDDVPLWRQTIVDHFDRFLFDLYQLFEAEGLLETGLYHKVEPIAIDFSDELFQEMEQIV